jgi:ATP-dependent exoDNAse (exonuclease V) beta subunit
LSVNLASGGTAEGLLGDLFSWESRLLAALRNEGVAPAVSQREAPRALAALRNALTDPTGRWILSSHQSAASEHPIASLDASVLRADRTFLAGSTPLVEGDDSIWIVDFKTTEQGSRSPERFSEDELLKYREQLERYAFVLRELSPKPLRIMLGLYYPLIPRLLHWISSETS